MNTVDSNFVTLKSFIKVATNWQVDLTAPDNIRVTVEYGDQKYLTINMYPGEAEEVSRLLDAYADDMTTFVYDDFIDALDQTAKEAFDLLSFEV